jgi:hypothetical protein
LLASVRDFKNVVGIRGSALEPEDHRKKESDEDAF